MQRVSMSKIKESWTESTERGFRDLSRGQLKDAARGWLDADAAVPADAAASDPIRAASRSNAGAARLLLGHGHAAASCFDAAAQCWRDVITEIASLDVPITGTSSSFHFRLATAVPNALIEARRNRYHRLAEAALAITQFNRALVEQRRSTSAISMHASALRPMLSDVIGAESPEARLLSFCIDPSAASDIFAIYADKLAKITSRLQTFAAAISSECARIESAVALTALLALPILLSAGRSGDKEFKPPAATRVSLNDV
jgi:hypothetical protein